MAAQDKVTFKQDLTEPVKIRHYEGVVFTGDDCGNIIKVALFDGGVPYSGGGTVSATAILADGTTFPLTQGSITDNMVSVPLEAGALVVSGLMGLYVKISGDGIICTVLNAIFTVQATDTGMVPAAMVTTVNELVQEIKDAQDSFPADLTNLLAAVAPTFSTSTAYSAGAYVWQGGKLYRFTAAHPAGTWTGADAVAVALGNDVADLKSAVDPLSKGINTDGKIYPYAIVDKNGKAALVLDEDGYAILKQKYLSTEADKLSINDGTGNTIVTQDTTGLYDYAVCDQDGKILFYVDSGVLHVKEIESDNVSLALDSMNKRQAKELNADRNKACNLDAEINMFIAYGQSWACGYDANAISTTQKYDNIMFDIGIKNDPLTDMDQTATSFIPMVEESTTSNGAGSQTTGETPVSAMCGMIKQLLADENGYDYTDVKYQMLGNCPGMGSKTLAELQKGTIYYNRLISQVQMAFDIASALGKKLVIQAFSWQQGELGKAGNYAECLEQLRADIDTDVKAITGQTQPVKCITWQTMLYTSGAAEDFYQRYVGASETYPNIICSGAAYQFKHVADNNLHLKSVDQDWAGAYLGLAYKRTIIDGTKFVPLKPIKAEIVGKSVYLKFDVPVKPIVFDTDTVTAADNKGFGLTNSGGTAKTISGVEIIAPDIIKITSSATIDGTDKISYGQNAGDSFGPTSGNRGNVRDSQGETIICTAGNGETIPLHNWLVCFNKTINDLMA